MVKTMNKSITKPSLERLARCAGVKTTSLTVTDVMRDLLTTRAQEVCKAILIINSQSGTRTIMPKDVYDALEHLGVKLTRSENMGDSTCSASG